MAKKNKATAYLLNDFKLENTKPSDKPITLRDGGGLYALINTNGSIYLQLRYRLNGKARKTQLGVYPKISLTKARDEARRLKNGLSENIDPIVEKRKQQADSRNNAEATVESIMLEWLHHKAKHVSPSYHTKISGMMKANISPKLGKLPVSDVTSGMIMETLKVIEKRGSVDLMHRVRALTAELFDYAISLDKYDRNNPAHALRGNVRFAKHEVEHYKTFTSVEDAGLFLRRLPDYKGDLITQLLVKLQMMFATRPSEMRTALWKEFDFTNSIWTIEKSRMKGKVEHVIPIPSQAITDLMELKELTGHSPYLFPSVRAKVGTLSEGTANKALKNIWTEYLIHPHGFRHFFSTICNDEAAADATIIETQLSHEGKKQRMGDIIKVTVATKDSDRIRGTYNSANYLVERRRLNQWYADYLDELRDGAKVSKLRKAKAQ
jgi:integrase